MSDDPNKPPAQQSVPGDGLGLCDCEEEPAAYRVVVTNALGVVLSQTDVCLTCARQFDLDEICGLSF